WVPKITGSPAWGDGSLLIVTFDEAESGDASSCCGEQPGPNSPNPGGTTQGNGGGRIGAVLLSQFVQPGSTNAPPYNTTRCYAALRTSSASTTWATPPSRTYRRSDPTCTTPLRGRGRA